MELLNEELREEIAPRKLLRQFSLNIPRANKNTDFHRSVDVHHHVNGTAGEFLASSLNQQQQITPSVVSEALHRWERRQFRWHTNNQSTSTVVNQSSTTSSLAHLAEVSRSFGRNGTVTLLNGLRSKSMLEIPNVALGEGQFDRLQESQLCDDEAFEVAFGEGYLGMEFVVDKASSQVVLKSVRTESWTRERVQLPPGRMITRGLVVDAINGIPMSSVEPDRVLELLQITPRPMTLRFRRCESSMVICKMCERKVDVERLVEHTSFCVHELEAEQINNSLARLAIAIKTNLQADSLGQYFTPEDRHLFLAIRMIAAKAASCDIASLESFTLCSKLLKMIKRVRHHAPLSGSPASIRGLKCCSRVRKLIVAKMNEMKATQKALLLQSSPNTIIPHPPNSAKHEGKPNALKHSESGGFATTGFHRTKSLEVIENAELASAHEHRLSRRGSTCRVSIRDFDIIKPISKGAFGKVYLAQKKTTGDQYAIKILAKEHVLRKKQLSHIETERDILAAVSSPFVVKLFWTFQSRCNLFLVMEYLPGGDFMSLLECIVQLEEQVARVYIAEIALALKHLHEKGCVHRDLKPDNILISSSGHIKLTDFGLSEEGVGLSESDSDDSYSDGQHVETWEELGEHLEKHEETPEAMEEDGSVKSDAMEVELSNMELCEDNQQEEEAPDEQDGEPMDEQKGDSTRTYSRCGTPDYLSPEIILCQPHGPPVDYWALGVILYEMLVGFPPFNDDSVDAIFNNILQRQILWPDGEKCLSLEAMDLIDRLLDPNPNTRMGWHELFRHPFFDGIDWDTLLLQTPPFVPTLEGPNDTSYFNNRNLTEVFVDEDDFEMSSVCSEEDEFEREFQSACASSVTTPAPSVATSENQLEEKSAGQLEDESIEMSDSMFDNEAFLELDHDLMMANGVDEGSGARTKRVDRIPSSSSTSGVTASSSQATNQANANETFRSFSFTNMNALAAASLREAEILANSRMAQVEDPSAPVLLL